MKIPYKMQSRDRILTDDELRRIWHACPQLGTFGRIVQTLHTNGMPQKRDRKPKKGVGAGRLARHPERAHEGKREHIIPVPSFTYSLIATLPTQSPFVFSAREKPETPFNGWSKSKSKLDKLSGVGTGVHYTTSAAPSAPTSPRWKCCDPDTAERLIGH